MLNTNKPFPRLSIRARLVVAFCAFAGIPVAVIGGWRFGPSSIGAILAVSSAFPNGVSL